jgi:hypothetical protein
LTRIESIKDAENNYEDLSNIYSNIENSRLRACFVEGCRQAGCIFMEEHEFYKLSLTGIQYKRKIA